MIPKSVQVVIISLLVVFAAGPASASCVIEGACYELSAEVVNCEEKDIGQKFLVVETKRREPKVVACGYPLAREAPAWEKEQNLGKLRGKKYFAIYKAGNLSCENLPDKFEEVSISGGCCDTLPAKGPCALGLEVLEFTTD